MKKLALLSVSDKTGLIEFARRLAKLDFAIISTGGTAAVLVEAGIAVTPVSDITEFPECLDGRVKTLHPRVHAGLLANQENAGHAGFMSNMGINYIDLLVVNLYPFRQTIANPQASFADAVENIDIGGPAMIRSAAKNSERVTVVVDPADYERTAHELEIFGATTLATRLKLMAKAFGHTAAYDAVIADYLNSRLFPNTYPQQLTLTYEKIQALRYGENPQQTAAYYREAKADAKGISSAMQLQGKELSYNNIADSSAALDLLKEFAEPCAVAVKHANPCGVAVAADTTQAFIKARDCDPVSIFGGIVALNREVDVNTARLMAELFLEVIIAPGYSAAALDVLSVKKNLRLLTCDTSAVATQCCDVKKVSGGLLVQSADYVLEDSAEYTCVTEKAPTAAQMDDLLFAWKVVKHVKSNAIVVALDNAAIGIGPGQTNRIWSAELAIQRASEACVRVNQEGISTLRAWSMNNAVLASDAFLPFPDVVALAAQHGVRALIQPGGSLRDAESIAACDVSGVAMVFTGCRHFRH